MGYYLDIMKDKISGFTIVEMAIVIVIIGLLLTTVMGFTSGLRQSSALSATIAREQTIKNALINFIATNNRLPCPAPSIPTPTSVLGVEDTPGNSAATACTNSNPSDSNTVGVKVVSGLIPWVSLGLTDDMGSDGYYNRFTYQVVQSATYNNLTSQTVVGIKGDISVHFSATPTATLGHPPVGNQVNYCIPAGSTSTYNSCAAVAVIVSHGSNGLGGFTRSGGATPSPVGQDELENTEDGNAKFVMKDASNDDANPFDDIILPLTSNDLLSPLTLNGSLQSANTLLSNEFKNITETIIANSFTNKSGNQYPLLGPASYIPPIIVNDPWGNPISVNIISSPITETSMGTDTAFILTSRGPDGTISTDDIIHRVLVSKVYEPFSIAGF
jgi:type II secretory pathway pseudopilin PulG